MNISTGSTATAETAAQTQSTTAETQSSTNTEKATAAQKAEDKKDEKTQETQSDFKKVLEEQKDTDKISIEQAQQLNNQNQMMINGEYANKFGFDTISSLKNIKSIYNYNSIKISKEDAKFFADLVENKQFAMLQNGDKANLIKFADEIGPTYKTQQTSKVLSDLITKAYNEQKPVRISFDNNVSVVLKVDTKGKISAEFIPGDKAVEAYLRNNINSLKLRFDDQNIPYNDIMYRQSNNGNQNRERQNQQRNKGE